MARFSFGLFKNRRAQSSPASKRVGSGDVAAPDIQEVPGSVATFRREGHHVRVGRRGSPLKQGFRSSQESARILVLP
jgi:hypothetical protein